MSSFSADWAAQWKADKLHRKAEQAWLDVYNLSARARHVIVNADCTDAAQVIVKGKTFWSRQANCGKITAVEIHKAFGPWPGDDLEQFSTTQLLAELARRHERSAALEARGDEA